MSVLPAFSKILERVMYNRLRRFLNVSKVLSDNQYGFCKHHSTAYACLYDKISSAIENKEYQKPIRVVTCNGPLCAGKKASEYSICQVPYLEQQEGGVSKYGT